MLANVLRTVLFAQLAASAGFAWLLIAHATWPLGWSVVAGLVIGQAVALGLHALILLGHFGLAAHSGSAKPDGHGSSFIGLAGTYLRELRDSIRTFSWSQVFYGNRPVASAPDDAPGIPVVFVHGYFCNRALWRPMASRLAQRGHATDSVNLEPVFGSIDDYAPLIDAAVRRLQQRTGRTKVALVCHSMGGLAARAYLHRYGSSAITKVITLGTPHVGTAHASAGRGVNARQMRRASTWLRELALGESESIGRLFTIVMTHQDNIVAPQAGQSIPGAEVIEHSGIGHVSLVYDPRIQDLVAARLA